VRPIPAPAPPPIIIPPTNRSTWVEPPELLEMRRHFNAGEYRACVEPIEALYFARRNTFHQGLLHYMVALLQLRLGLMQTPRKLLGQALVLWEPYPAWQEGVDVVSLREHAVALLEALPEGVHSVPPEEVAHWWIAPPVL
jgi:hypothetical protein